MTSQEHKRIIKAEKLICREFYEYYREHRTKVCKGINDYNLFKKAVSGLLSVIRRKASEVEGGVHIKKLGYFRYVQSKNERKKRKKTKSFFEKTVKYKNYFFYISLDEKFDGWQYSPKLMCDMHKKNIEYKNHIKAIRSFYEMETISVRISKNLKRPYKY